MPWSLKWQERECKQRLSPQFVPAQCGSEQACRCRPPVLSPGPAPAPPLGGRLGARAFTRPTREPGWFLVVTFQSAPDTGEKKSNESLERGWDFIGGSLLGARCTPHRPVLVGHGLALWAPSHPSAFWEPWWPPLPDSTVLCALPRATYHMR